MNSIFKVTIEVWCDGNRQLNGICIADSKESAIELFNKYSCWGGYLENGDWSIVGYSDLAEQVLARETC